MKKRGRKNSPSKKTFNNRLLYSLIALGVLVIITVGVYASGSPAATYGVLNNGTSPNPGHPADQIGAPVGCQAGQFLYYQVNSSGYGSWNCTSVASSVALSSSLSTLTQNLNASQYSINNLTMSGDNSGAATKSYVDAAVAAASSSGSTGQSTQFVLGGTYTQINTYNPSNLYYPTTWTKIPSGATNIPSSANQIVFFVLDNSEIHIYQSSQVSFSQNDFGFYLDSSGNMHYVNNTISNQQSGSHSWSNIATAYYPNSLGVGGCSGSASQGCIHTIAEITDSSTFGAGICKLGIDGQGNLYYTYTAYETTNYPSAPTCVVGYYYR